MVHVSGGFAASLLHISKRLPLAVPFLCLCPRRVSEVWLALPHRGTDDCFGGRPPLRRPTITQEGGCRRAWPSGYRSCLCRTRWGLAQASVGGAQSPTLSDAPSNFGGGAHTLIEPLHDLTPRGGSSWAAKPWSVGKFFPIFFPGLGDLGLLAGWVSPRGGSRIKCPGGGSLIRSKASLIRAF